MKKFTLMLIVLIVCFIPSLLLGAETHVTTAEELQSALTTMEASSNDGIIYLAEGTYQGLFTYESTSTGASKSLTIKAEDGLEADQVILDGNDQGRTITISASSQSLDVLMERMTIRRGYVSAEYGGGVYINTQGNVSLEELRVLDNTGSGVFVYGAAELILNNSYFSNNSGAANHGGCGLRAYSITSITLEKNIFSNNTTNGRYNQYGGAVYISEINSVILDKNTFSDNYAADDGGAVYIDTGLSSSVLLVHNIFSNNSTGDWGGGVVIYSRYGHADTITVTNNLIIKNYAKNGAGGIHLYDKSAVLEIVNNTILRNYNDGTSGGGINIPSDGARLLRIYNNVIQENENSSGDQDIWAGPTIEKLYNNNVGVVAGTSEYEGSNINADSSFVSPDDDDYHLNSDSPCIDKGSNEAYEIADTDLEGTDRFINDFIDIGAYEYVGTGDNPVCSADHPEFCQCEYDCELIGNAWWKGACYNMSDCGTGDSGAYTQEDLDAQYEAGKRYCIDNPEECGISTVDGKCTQEELKIEYNNGFADGQATCASGGCAVLEENLDITMPCIDIFGTNYPISLEKIINKDDPFGYYWKLPLE